MGRAIDEDLVIDIVSYECGEWSGLAKEIEKQIMALPTANHTLYGYNIEHLAFIEALLQKENISPEELKDMLSDIGRMTKFVIDDITDTIQRNWKVIVNGG